MSTATGAIICCAPFAARFYAAKFYGVTSRFRLPAGYRAEVSLSGQAAPRSEADDDCLCAMPSRRLIRCLLIAPCRYVLASRSIESGFALLRRGGGVISD